MKIDIFIGMLMCHKVIISKKNNFNFIIKNIHIVNCQDYRRSLFLINNMDGSRCILGSVE